MMKAETIVDPCVRCGGPSETTVKGKRVCKDCKAKVFVGKY